MSESVKALHAYLRQLFNQLLSENPPSEPEMDGDEILRMALRDLLGREPTDEEIRARTVHR